MKYLFIFSTLLLITFTSCEKESKVNYTPDKVVPSTDQIAVYFKKNFETPYGTYVHWRWDDRLVDMSNRLTPIKRKYCIPYGDMILKYWIAPFLSTKNGEKFFKKLFPSEIVFIGSKIYDATGHIFSAAYAEAGVRIVFSACNEFRNDPTWIKEQIHIMEHEFSHIVAANYDYPKGFRDVGSEKYGFHTGYTSDRAAIAAGSPTLYGLNNVNECWAELIGTYLSTSETEFNNKFINPEATTGFGAKPDAEAVNKGRLLIKTKMDMIKAYYVQNFNIDLSELRDEVLKRINALITEQQAAKIRQKTKILTLPYFHTVYDNAAATKYSLVILHDNATLTDHNNNLYQAAPIKHKISIDDDNVVTFDPALNFGTYSITKFVFDEKTKSFTATKDGHKIEIKSSDTSTMAKDPTYINDMYKFEANGYKMWFVNEYSYSMKKIYDNMSAELKNNTPNKSGFKMIDPVHPNVTMMLYFKTGQILFNTVAGGFIGLKNLKYTVDSYKLVVTQSNMQVVGDPNLMSHIYPNNTGGKYFLDNFLLNPSGFYVDRISAKKFALININKPTEYIVIMEP